MFFMMLETLENPSERDRIEGLYHKYSGFVKCLVIKKFDVLTKEADDIVNEVFVRVIKYKDRFDIQNEKECVRLLVVYTRSICINLCNRKNLEYQAYGEFYKEFEDIGEGQTDELFSKLFRRTAVKKAVEILEGLPPRPKEMVRLKFFCGSSNRQIADLMGMSESNVNVTLKRTLDKMKKELEEYYD